MAESSQTSEGMPAHGLEYATPDNKPAVDPVKRGRTLLITATLLGVVLVLLSLPDLHQPGPPTWVIRCLAYPVGMVALMCGLLGVFYSWGKDAGRVNLRWAGVAIALAMLAGLMTYTTLGWRASFRLHESSFDRAVAAMPGTRPGAVGLYRIEQVTTDSGGGVWFATKETDAGFIWDYWYDGFVYQPTPGADPLGNRGNLRLRSLGNGWYAFRTRWSD
ncbi:MAG: hypothetical protein AAF656_05795 [Planctomycetota bacterium]